jgi:LysR family transcriptional activator of nhaA
VLVDDVEARHQDRHVGTIDGIEEHFYAISVERRITHACVLAITSAARGELFQPTALPKSLRAGLRRKAG